MSVSVYVFLESSLLGKGSLAAKFYELRLLNLRWKWFIWEFEGLIMDLESGFQSNPVKVSYFVLKSFDL